MLKGLGRLIRQQNEQKLRDKGLGYHVRPPALLLRSSVPTNASPVRGPD